MNKNTTQDYVEEVEPRPETLSFIMQFARICHVEQNLPLGLAVVILN
jgi:hypothetical protein